MDRFANLFFLDLSDNTAIEPNKTFILLLLAAILEAIKTG